MFSESEMGAGVDYKKLVETVPTSNPKAVYQLNLGRVTDGNVYNSVVKEFKIPVNWETNYKDMGNKNDVMLSAGEDMKKSWKGEKSVESIINLVDQRYFVHPCDVDWIDEHIEKWAQENLSKVKRGESKTIYDHGKKEFEKFKKEVDDKIKQYS